MKAFPITIILVLLAPLFMEADIVVRNTGRCDPYGNCDITQGLVTAWREACSLPFTNKIVVPKGRYLLDQVVLVGPCDAPMQLQMDGAFVCARQDPRNFPRQNLGWVNFQYLDSFILTGNSYFNGVGAFSWWRQLCSGNPSVCTSIRFDFITNSDVSGLSSTDSKMFHFTIFGSKNLTLSNLHITAPETSVNTDGIHISRSTDVKIDNAIIGTGDDCISIGDGTTHINITRAYCGPGHGISIGSLGKYQDEMPVQGITVTDSVIRGTQNGVRVKTMAGSSVRGLVSNVIFQNIVMKNVINPVIIDQYYCPGRTCTGSAPSLVQIENIAFNNIRGTSASEAAVEISCSPHMRCREIHVGYIDLAFNVGRGAVRTSSICRNAVDLYFYSRQTPKIVCT